MRSWALGAIVPGGNNVTGDKGCCKRKRGVWWRKAYIYFILLLKLGWMLSGYHRKTYITHAQLRLAKTGHELACMRARSAGVRRGGCDLLLASDDDDEEGEGAWMDSFAIASMTRAKT